MPISTMLNLREKESIKGVKHGLFKCNFLRSARLDSCATDLFPGTFIYFCFMMFTEDLMKGSVRMLIHVRKLFNCKVSFKMLFSMFHVILEKKT